MKVLIVLLCFVGITMVADAQWQSEHHGVATPESIATDSSGSRILVSMHGNAGVWLTNNGGTNWEQINHRFTDIPLLKSIPLCRFVSVGTTADTLIFNVYPIAEGVIPVGEYHSYDGGMIWDSFSYRVNDFWPDTLDNISFGGDQAIIMQDRCYYDRQSGFCISTDHGQTWEVVDVSAYECGLKSVLFNQTNPDSIYMFGAWGHDTPDPESDIVGGVIASYDGGYTWERIIPIETMTNEENGEIPDFARGAGSNLYALTSWLPQYSYPPVLWSQDNGQSWQWTGESGLPNQSMLTQIEAVPERPGRIIVGHALPSGVWESEDHGFTWHRLLRGLPEIPSIVMCIYRNPFSGHLYVSLKDQGMYRSIDFGDTWQQLPGPQIGIYSQDYFHGMVGDEGGILHGALESTSYFAVEGEANFQPVPCVSADEDHSVFLWPVCYTSNHAIFLARATEVSTGLIHSSIIHSETNGNSWIETQNTIGYIDKLLSVEVNSNLALVSSDQNYNLRYSYDLGATWENLTTPFFSGPFIQDSNNKIYIRQALPPFTLWRNRDLSDNWENLEFPDLQSLNIGNFTAPVELNDTLYVRSLNILYAMDPDGSWEDRGNIWQWNSIINDIDIAIVSAQSDTFIAAVGDYNHYLSLSTDMGWTWEEKEIEMPPDLHGEAGIDIVYDSWRDRLWIDTGVGLAYLDNPTMHVGEDIWHFQPATYATMTSYPNPFNANTTVRFTLTKPGDVKLDVYDLLGRRVATLVDGLTTPGEHSVSLDARELSSGSYFLRLDTPEQSLNRRITLVK